jgi:nucleotide-binding universal stress UspA family protein
MIIRSIVCPVDFSSESRTLVRGALAVARHEGAKVTVVHVLEPLLAQAAALSRERDWLKKEAYTQIGALIAGAVEGTGVDPRTIGRRVRCGEPDAEILAAAAEFNADLIVMGTEALRGVRRLFFGSVAARVLAQTEVPVLALPPLTSDLLLSMDETHRLPLHHILVAVDFSDTTMIAVREAADLARRWGASLTLLHVVPELPDVPHWREALDEHQRHAIERARRELELVAREIAGVPVSVLTVPGDPEESIIRVAGERERTIVALGLCRTRSGWFAPRPGSTAYRVLSLTNVPVLVVPGTRIGKAPVEEQYACASGHF